ncbi:MAG: biotin/lipoyl-containing protein [Anaeromyxobacteraceae bacterium]
MRLQVKVDGRTYDVEVEATEAEAPRPAHLAVAHARPQPPAAFPPAAAPAATPVADELKVCRSPMTGMVVRAAAQPGQAMQVGDLLLVLEAMKMETNITAPVAARIARVNVKAGDAVKTGQVLVEFE